MNPTDRPARSTSARRRRLIAVVAGVVAATLGGSVVALSSLDSAADLPSVKAVRVDPPTPAVVIGDSAIAALRWVPNAAGALVGFDHTLDLESCRRLVQTSCTGREGRRPPTLYDALSAHGDNYHTLVVATGYNDGTSSFAESFELIVGRARALGYERIVWWTLRSDVDYVSPDSIGNHLTFAANNRVLRNLVATGKYPEVVLADWGAYTVDRHEWFATDGVHYRSIGAWGAADYLTRTMAFLDGRACPFPDAPSEPPEDPCPGPDLTGPVTELEALYPIGEDGILCYEIGEDRRFECRDDTHVLQLTRELEPGMQGSDVESLQIRLQRLANYGDTIDGVYGPTTTEAVAAFQRTRSLRATGRADIDTLAELGFDTSGITPPNP